MTQKASNSKEFYSLQEAADQLAERGKIKRTASEAREALWRNFWNGRLPEWSVGLDMAVFESLADDRDGPTYVFKVDKKGKPLMTEKRCFVEARIKKAPGFEPFTPIGIAQYLTVKECPDLPNWQRYDRLAPELLADANPDCWIGTAKQLFLSLRFTEAAILASGGRILQKKRQVQKAVATSTYKDVVLSDLSKWYKDHWIPSCTTSALTPSREDDLSAARKHFADKKVSRAWMRDLRRVFAPDTWRKLGPKNSGKPISAAISALPNCQNSK